MPGEPTTVLLLKNRMFRVTGTWLAISLLLSGCTTGSISFAGKHLAAVSPVTVVHTELPPFGVRTHASVWTTALVGVAVAPLAGGLGAGAVVPSVSEGLEAKGSEEARRQILLPDFGLLITQKFLEAAGKEIPTWSDIALTIIDGPVNERYRVNTGTLLEFKVETWRFNSWRFTSNVIAEMRSPSGGVLWRKHYFYSGSSFNRSHSWEEFRADEGKLLKQEIEFAADTIASDFVRHLKGGD